MVNFISSDEQRTGFANENRITNAYGSLTLWVMELLDEFIGS